jgi:hypothetical protein
MQETPSCLICYDLLVPRVAPQQLELEVTPIELDEEPQKLRDRSQPSASARLHPGSDDASRSAAAKLLAVPEALLTRSHLRALGLERRAVDAVFRSVPVVALPGYSRPMIRAHDFVELIAEHTYRGDRVRPPTSTARGARLG